MLHLSNLSKPQKSTHMKTLHIHFLIGFFIATSAVYSQTSLTISATPHQIIIDPQVKGPRIPNRIISGDLPEYNPIWNEDFSGGLSAGWLNQGFTFSGTPNPTALWEYRGPTTTPDHTVGSRGGASSFIPINSTTAANGFMIFDSEYLDNGGNVNGPGTGPSPGPHVGILTSPTLNLSMEPHAILLFEQYFHMLLGGPTLAWGVPTTFLEFSTDGGSTWGNRTPLNTGLNAIPSRNSFLFYLDVSSVIGGAGNARFRFLFEGQDYFWMIDDIALVQKPNHALHVSFDNYGFKHDVFYDTPSEQNPKYGHMSGRECRNVYFASEFFNSGLLPQTNVRFVVNVMDVFGTTLRTITSTPQNLQPGDTAIFPLNTAMFWAACNDGERTYKVVFKAISDNIPATIGSVQPADTFLIRITDSTNSLHFGDHIYNLIGTNENFGYDGIAFGMRFDLKRDERVFKTRAWLSSRTVPGGTINASLYQAPTTFNFLTGFNTITPIATQSHVITAADVAANEISISFLDPNGFPLFLPTGNYYLVWELFSDNGVKPIFLGNNADFRQAGANSVMYIDRPNMGGLPRWYSAFSNSSDFVNPMIELITCPSEFATTCMTLQVHPVDPPTAIRVYPNPSAGLINIHFDTHNHNRYDILLSGAGGEAVYRNTFGAAAQHTETLDFRHLSPGIYFLQLRVKTTLVGNYKVVIK
jgi:hypothetical protein